MTRPVGGSFTYFVTEGYENNVKLKDFNAKISFNRGSEEYNNSVTIANNNTYVDKHNNRPSKIKVTNDYELPVLQNIFNFDGDKTTFSKKDYEILLSNVGKTIRLKNCAYEIKASKEEIAQGIINIHLCDKLADGTAEPVNKEFTIDIETEKEIANGNTLDRNATLTVKWDEAGKCKTREVKFIGNYGFSINNTNYTVKNGKIFDKNNQEIKELKLDKKVAYQFIGMSCTAESARDYTYTEKDFKEANYCCNYPNPNYEKIARAIGSGADNLIKAEYDGTKYTTECGHYTEEGFIFKKSVKHSNTVSIWNNN